jgi:glycosyltransferase involved in cell wall biosynthesis
MEEAELHAVSVVIPAYNEEAAIGQVLADARKVLDGLDGRYEIIVVDDCSADRTGEIARKVGVTVVRNVQNGGYGYSLMRGIRAARYDTVAILDGDGSYPLEELPDLIDKYRRGFAMVVGQRHGRYLAPTTQIRVMRGLFRALVQFIVGGSVPDVNSGMRIFDRAAVLPLFPHMSYGFSFTTSITLLFILQALPVAWVPVTYRKRKGSSKVHYLRDSLRALQILASITARLNPIKLFLLGALVNAVVLTPLALLLSIGRSPATPVMVVLTGSAVITALGLAVDAVVDKSPLSTRQPSTATGVAGNARRDV